MLWRYINLDNERNNHMINFFQKKNLSFKRIQGVSPQNNLNDLVDLSHPNLHPNLSKICCLLSHLTAIEDFYFSNEKLTIICEDDLDDKFFHLHSIPKIIDNAPPDWEILQLSYSLTKPEKCFLENQFVPWKTKFYGTLCYLINQKGAQNIINNIFQNHYLINYNFKYLVADYVLYESVKTYTYYLSLFISDLKFTSQIQNSNSNLIKYNQNAIKIYQLLKII